MFRKMNLSVLAVVLGLAACGFSSAEYITVPNYSFESPDISSSPGVTYTFDNWTRYGEAIIFENGYSGSTYTNLEGGQVGSVTTEGAGGRAYQELSSNYTIGQSYTLTAGFAKTEITPTGYAENKAYVTLFWDDEGAQTVIGTQEVRWGDLSSTLLTDYSVTIPTVQSSDAYAGKPIGVMISAGPRIGTTNMSYFAVDNVRLEGISIPEPGTWVLATTALSGLVCYAWRKRR